jgi:hypothetical protein
MINAGIAVGATTLGFVVAGSAWFATITGPFGLAVLTAVALLLITNCHAGGAGQTILRSLPKTLLALISRLPKAVHWLDGSSGVVNVNIASPALGTNRLPVHLQLRSGPPQEAIPVQRALGITTSESGRRSTFNLSRSTRTAPYGGATIDT